MLVRFKQLVLFSKPSEYLIKNGQGNTFLPRLCVLRHFVKFISGNVGCGPREK